MERGKVGIVGKGALCAHELSDDSRASRVMRGWLVLVYWHVTPATQWSALEFGREDGSFGMVEG